MYSSFRFTLVVYWLIQDVFAHVNKRNIKGMFVQYYFVCYWFSDVRTSYTESLSFLIYCIVLLTITWRIAYYMSISSYTKRSRRWNVKGLSIFTYLSVKLQRKYMFMSKTVCASDFVFMLIDLAYQKTQQKTLDMLKNKSPAP